MSVDERPCVFCGDPLYLTVAGVWRHVERDYVHSAIPKEDQ